jgi:hypothetical protein
LQKCPTHKKIYPTESVAEEALIAAWIAYDYPQGNGPVNIYICDDCGNYHLTSKGAMNKKLEEQIASGKIRRDKDVNAWMDKIKRKNRS